jgi:hypothetical protein
LRTGCRPASAQRNHRHPSSRENRAGRKYRSRRHGIAPHRQAAFDGASFLMDFLKTARRSGRRNIMKDGGSTANGVDAKDADDKAKLRWQKS